MLSFLEAMKNRNSQMVNLVLAFILFKYFIVAACIVMFQKNIFSIVSLLFTLFLLYWIVCKDCKCYLSYVRWSYFFTSLLCVIIILLTKSSNDNFEFTVLLWSPLFIILQYMVFLWDYNCIKYRYIAKIFKKEGSKDRNTIAIESYFRDKFDEFYNGDTISYFVVDIKDTTFELEKLLLLGFIDVVTVYTENDITYHKYRFNEEIISRLQIKNQGDNMDLYQISNMEKGEAKREIKKIIDKYKEKKDEIEVEDALRLYNNFSNPECGLIGYLSDHEEHLWDVYGCESGEPADSEYYNAIKVLDTMCESDTIYYSDGNECSCNGYEILESLINDFME